MIDAKLFEKWVNAGLIGKSVFLSENEIYYLLKNQYEYTNSLNHPKKHAEKSNAFYLALISRIFSPDFILWKFCSIQTHRTELGLITWKDKSIALSPYEWAEYLIDVEPFSMFDPIDSIADKLFPLIDQLRFQILKDAYYSLRWRIHPKNRPYNIDLWNLWEFLGEKFPSIRRLIIGNTSTVLKLEGLVGDKSSPIQFEINNYDVFGFPGLPENELIVAPFSQHNTSSFVYYPNIIFYKNPTEKLLKTLRNFHLFDSNDPAIKIKFNTTSF
jgi:hypothetical protein